MALFSYRPRDMFYSHPVERYVSRALDRAFTDLADAMRPVAPYWLDQSALEECNVGNAVGRIAVDKEKFAVEVNVSEFRPEELSVNVRDRELVIEGHHEERSDDSGRIERHFVRKYTIPEGAQLDTLESSLSDKGILNVTAKMAAIEEPPSRNIPIQSAPSQEEKGN